MYDGRDTCVRSLPSHVRAHDTVKPTCRTGTDELHVHILSDDVVPCSRNTCITPLICCATPVTPQGRQRDLAGTKQRPTGTPQDHTGTHRNPTGPHKSQTRTSRDPTGITQGSTWTQPGPPSAKSHSPSGPGSRTNRSARIWSPDRGGGSV